MLHKCLRYMSMTFHRKALFFKSLSNPQHLSELVLVQNVLYNLFAACHPYCQQHELNAKCLRCTHHVKRCAALSLSLPLRAVVGASALEPGQPNPQLQGQTQATAQPDGAISISELSLLAKPGSYNVSVTLPDYPLVSILLSSLLVGKVSEKVVAWLIASQKTHTYTYW